MAKEHLNKEYLQRKSIYEETLENLKDIKELYLSGDLTEEEYQEAVDQVDRDTLAYETFAYAMYLLNLPKSNKHKIPKETLEWKNYFDQLYGKISNSILEADYNVLDIKDLIQLKKTKKEIK